LGCIFCLVLIFGVFFFDELFQKKKIFLVFVVVMEEESTFFGGAEGLELPVEVVLEVLTRLPVADLVRVEAVCRRWRGFLSAASPLGSTLWRTVPPPPTSAPPLPFFFGLNINYLLFIKSFVFVFVLFLIFCKAHMAEFGGPLPTREEAGGSKQTRKRRLHEDKRGDWRRFCHTSLRTLYRYTPTYPRTAHARHDTTRRHSRH
jgi:hypothetical protein